MSRRNSLRFRILVSFVVAGAVLGPLLTTVMLWATYTIEERAAAQGATGLLEDVLATPHEYLLQRPSTDPDLYVLTRLRASSLPPELARLPDGVHELETDSGAWMVALATTTSARYAVVEDITTLEQRERVSVLVVVAGTAVAIYVSLWLGFSMSRRLLLPLTRLSQRVATANLAGEDGQLAREFADDEVGQLAAALDRYGDRMSAALRREREFSADASHELRNPLSVIQNAAELIEADAASSERSRRAAARVRLAARRMSETVSVLLTLAREDLGSAMQAEAVPVADCVEALIAEEGAAAAPGDATPIQWRRDAEPRLAVPRVVVESIARNLIRNACQHARARSIQVVLQADRLLVIDDGVGVPAAELPQILARGARGTNARGSGFGLGLSLVQRLCDRFGWTLSVDSQPGVSTRVEWRFG